MVLVMIGFIYLLFIYLFDYLLFDTDYIANQIHLDWAELNLGLAIGTSWADLSQTQKI